MSNIVDFLERLGRDAQLRYAASAEVEEALLRAQIAPALRAALLAEDSRRLEALLGVKANVCCMVHVPDDDDDDDDDDDEDEEDDDQDDGDDDQEDDEPTSRRSVFRRVAAAS